MRENFCGDVHSGIAFTAEEEIAAYRAMLLIRRFEEKAGQLYALGEVQGPCYLSIGQEAVAVGLEMAARASDLVITGYRCHGHMLARGSDPAPMMAEMLGRTTGQSQGRGGSVHMFDPRRGFYGGHAELALQVPLGAGLAFAARYKGSDAVCLCTLGDGAAHDGLTYETFRMASEWRLAIVFVIDNNSTETSLRLEPHENRQSLAARGAPFGIPGAQVDGIDVRKVRSAARKAIGEARSGAGPVILEALTYRYRGHEQSPGGGRELRTREETDPIAKARARIVEERVLTETELDVIDREIKDRISEAVSLARDVPKRHPADPRS